MKITLISISLFFLSSCGYRWDFPSEGKISVYIPFIQGDEEGTLTNAIIRELCATGKIQPCSQSDAAYRLEISIEHSENETIGFRRDLQKTQGEINRNLVACEARKAMSLKAVCYRGKTSEIVKGPYFISADVDYDYVDGDSLSDLGFINSEGNFTLVLPFSLGQLEPKEAANDAATRPLYAQLAQKLADVISFEYE